MPPTVKVKQAGVFGPGLLRVKQAGQFVDPEGVYVREGGAWVPWWSPFTPPVPPLTDGLFGQWDARHLDGTEARPADGAAVTSWVDLTGTFAPLTVLAGSPTYNEAAKPTVELTNARMTANRTAFTPSGVTCYALCRTDTPGFVLASESAYSLTPSGTTNAISRGGLYGSDWQHYTRRLFGDATDMSDPSTGTPRIPVVAGELVPIAWQVDWTGRVSRVMKSTDTFTKSPTTWASGAPSPIVNVVLGGSQTGHALKGGIASVLMYDRLHSDAERQSILTWLSSYGA